MKRRKEPSPEKMKASIDARVAIRRLEQHERYLALLRQAQRIRLNSNAPDTLVNIITSGESELQSLLARSGGKVSPRRRPQKTTTPNNRCIIFVDECGASSLTSPDEFKAFVMSAVIVPEDHYSKLDTEWKQWKAKNLGSTDKIIHEPEVRREIGPFYFHKNISKRSLVIQSLNELIVKLDFAAVVCVVNRPEYLSEFGINSMDKSLPEHPYLMTLDFLMERLVIVLERQFGGARAHVVAEARGPLEDALLQYEYVRLQLDGTSYVSSSWFRQQLVPAIEFRTKKENCTGLQLTDLLARPCGEKVLDPPSTPARWPQFRDKLCLGQETAHSILGLKIIPWNDRYVDIWKS